MKKIILLILLLMLTGCAGNKINIDFDESILELERFDEEPDWYSEIKLTQKDETIEMEEDFIIEDVDVTKAGTYTLTVSISDKDEVLKEQTYDVTVTEPDFDTPEEVVAYFYGMLNEMYNGRAELVEFCSNAFMDEEAIECENSGYDSASFNRIHASNFKVTELTDSEKAEINLEEFEKVMYVSYLQEVKEEDLPEYFTNYTYVVYVDGRYYLESF